MSDAAPRPSNSNLESRIDMVDYNELRKKFPAKTRKRKSNAAAIKQIAREYELKKAELEGLKAPQLKKGLVFYTVVAIGLLMLGSLVLSATGKGGRAPVSRAMLDARKSVDALATALGRYRYHTGEYPDSLEELASTKIVKAGWNGPYVKQIVPDPWGAQYEWNPAGPALYSKGPDGLGGTTDDVVAARDLFDAPFKDTSWTRNWVPYRLRGIVVAPDEETKAVVASQVSNYLAAASRAASEEAKEHSAFLARTVDDVQMNAAREAILATADKIVHILGSWTYDEDAVDFVEVSARVKGDSAELFVNNESQGRMGAGVATPGGECLLTWNRVKYEPGEIKVIGWRDGSPVGEDSLVTAFEPQAVRLRVLQTSLGDDEIGYALADWVDDRGIATPPPQNPEIAFSIEGPGEIIRSQDGLVAFRRNRPSGESLLLKAASGRLRPAAITIPWRNIQ